MAPPTPDALRQQIARSETDPVYLIAGDDEHEKSALALAFGEMVEEGLRAFNVERLYATDRAVTALLVTEAARTPDRERRLALYREADRIWVAEEAVVCALFYGWEPFSFTKPWVKGAEISPVGHFSIKNIMIEPH